MIRWFAKNGIAANLLMAFIVAGGIFSIRSVKMELFPYFTLGRINITVPYPGAAPEEVEETICKRIEEKIQDLDGIKKLNSSAAENVGNISIEVERGYDISKLIDKIRTRVDSIQSFPELSEYPTVEEAIPKREVLNLAIHGQAEEKTLKELANKVRDDLVQIPGISQVQAISKPYEVSIAVPEQKLREHGLRFEQILAAVRGHSVDLSGGFIENESGKILLRTKGQAYYSKEFSEIPVIKRPDGSRLLLGDIAKIDDGLADIRIEATFQGEPASFLSVLEVGGQSPLEISDSVREYIRKIQPNLPDGITITPWSDISFYLEGRLKMLVQNGLIGLALVLVILTFFLRPSLAVWVSIGIPISFLGTFFVMPLMGMTINLISLFAFILVLGIVVDDAIVVGESVFTRFQKDGPGVESAIDGTQRVAMPVTFAVLTSTVAFIPILFIPGFQGKFLVPIPLIVIPTLLFSLLESKLILPYHLSLCKVGHGQRERLNAFQRLQRKVADGLEAFIEKWYKPTLARCMHHRYATFAFFLTLLAITIGAVKGGWIRMMRFPAVPSDYIFVTLKMPDGTSFEKTRSATSQLEQGLGKLRDQLETEGYQDPFKHIFRITGSTPFGGGGPANIKEGPEDTNVAQMIVELDKSEARALSAPKLAARWRKAIGNIPGVRTLDFNATAAGRAGKPIEIELAGKDNQKLVKAAEEVKNFLSAYPSVFSIFDSHSSGKQEIQLKLKPSAQSLGITQADLARQVRYAFYGAEAQRIQRDREDIRVMIRYPKNERTSIANLENLRIRTPSGQEIPFNEIADAHIKEGFSTIQRTNRRRTILVSADLDKSAGNLESINEAIATTLIPQLRKSHPDVITNIEGEALEAKEGNQTLLNAFLLALLAMYALLAIPFKSYIQPIIVMSVIPFGLVGAVMGHWIFQEPLSQLSTYGIVALAGIVVNDSLVLVDYINRRRLEGECLIQAVRTAGVARFRPILLTSLTTFAGLTPILLETSLQAQFLIPMAISLSFGVLFATLITLLLVPCLYLALEDFRQIGKKVWKLFPEKN
ncbi:MAG: efflux RND transporter permease subunit [Opitutae bacterium]|nr:efflux RND transporter permease subunit [Opitutae bacterium]MBT5377470.1 efflux RND transporter permease subunit [Opitutae bacterium]MBT5691032.1 efflux RND transporter permease subunit [Opitutae bacterium]MBT6462078.1 efflux RND transporter permease subunit [Opitutae bacterium]MBT7854995.1 efflux RND transporter permease subunit [Opitutae bacterium]